MGVIFQNYTDANKILFDEYIQIKNCLITVPYHKGF